MLGAAREYAAMANRFANGFDHPPDFADWFMGEAATASCLFPSNRCVGTIAT